MTVPHHQLIVQFDVGFSLRWIHDEKPVAVHFLDHVHLWRLLLLPPRIPLRRGRILHVLGVQVQAVVVGGGQIKDVADLSGQTAPLGALLAWHCVCASLICGEHIMT
jgi:hypothetical protein